VTWRGSSFQTRAAATGKARPPTVDNRVRRTISDDELMSNINLCHVGGSRNKEDDEQSLQKRDNLCSRKFF